MRVVLNESDFKALTSGHIIEKEGVKIILQDIGYNRMNSIINENIANYENKNLSKESTKDS